MNDRCIACPRLRRVHGRGLPPGLREPAAHGPTYGDTEDVGLIPPDDPDNPTVREIRPGAPHAPPDPPKT